MVRVFPEGMKMAVEIPALQSEREESDVRFPSGVLVGNSALSGGGAASTDRQEEGGHTQGDRRGEPPGH